MSLLKKNYWETFLVSVLFIAGLFYRLKGISTNHSFWADEALVSSFGRDIVQGKINLWDGVNLQHYQRLQIFTSAIFFKLFGISEWSARLPSVLWGSVGIVFAYLVAKKYSNKWGGFLAAFLFTFLQLNLAHSTQAKPYVALETLFLMAIYFADKNLLATFMIATVATLYNYIGIMVFIPFFIQLFSGIKKVKIPKIYFVIGPIGLIILGWFLHVDIIFRILLQPQYNWVTYLRDLFWRQYAFISLPAIFGLFSIKDKKIFLGVTLSFLVLLFSWNFIFYSHNIRYLMPIFGLLTVLFGIFWGRVGEVLYKKPALVCLSVAVLIFAGGYKVVRKPAVYYTPNADFFADVQNADYKTFFAEVYKKFPDFDKYPVFSDLYDPFAWYSTKKPDALFMRVVTAPTPYDHYPVVAYPSLDYFLTEMSKYPRGFVFVEDWHSILPDDIKEYVKKNLKREIRVESMVVSPDDKWPLELYSWGFDDKK